MPSPISSNSSVYEPSVGGCDPEVMSCAPVESRPVAVVAIPPVQIDGEAGARELVKSVDAARGTPNCTAEKLDAARNCAIAGATALVSVASSATVVAAVGGFALTTLMSSFCGQSLRVLDDCEAP